MPLTVLQIQNAKPQIKPYGLPDGGGLSLWIKPDGGKYWHFRYRINGKQPRISFGVYPVVSLQLARERAAEARTMVAKGIDLSEKRKTDKRADATSRSNTFESIANEWHAHRAGRWASASALKARAYLDKDLIPTLRNKPIDAIQRTELVATISKIEKRGALNVAKKCRQWLNQIFRYALAKGLLNYNPATDLDVVAAHAPATKHHPFIPFTELPNLLRKLDESTAANLLTKSAIHLLLLTAARPGELRAAPWGEFDLDRGVWTIPAKRMKMRRAHAIPLPTQAVSILRVLQGLTGCNELVFAGRNDPDRPMSENTVNKCLSDLGFKGQQTGHGFRHLVSTELNNRGFNRDWIERQLAHGDANEIRDTYNHATYLDQRRSMMQEWADLAYPVAYD
ncbi:tyrosine-type recombinase/integrase [Pseudomonas frederiksbergensis]|uniref:tyrosine-type recombinase/integrase n=1 Tax=Pseudomonas frederiksbergensis TaxID=104087 RepID=UPI000F4A351F|nr:tyrosine-type recombinase/integrase [Pseudomonas frederiksbergensis]RON42967.1 integrase [Pseudomonas frederiksbergensis]